MPAAVSDFTGILGYTSWAPDVPNGPMVITYSFSNEGQSPWPYSVVDYDIATFQEFTAEQETTARAALGAWEAASGLMFIEVAAGEGDITFGNYDLEDDLAGATVHPLRLSWGVYSAQTEEGGSIAINATLRDDTSMSVMLHEIGHALGLSDATGGPLQLLPEFDSSAFTVMSDNGPAAEALGVFDEQAIQDLYGGPDILTSGGGALLEFDLDEEALTTSQVWDDQSSEIWGSSLDDHIQGGGGDDRIAGFNGTDVLNGGAGDDTLSGAYGADTLRGEQGNDIIVGAGDGQTPEGGNLLEGGVGFDTIVGLSGNDTLIGGLHADLLYVGFGDNLLDGGQGFDLLQGGRGQDTLLAGSETDRAFGGSGDDLIYGGGNSVGGIEGLWGDNGDDTIYGEAGFDRLDGGNGRDLLSGGAHADNLFGGAGYDTLFGGQGNDRLFGGLGYDRANGGTGDDAVFGNEGFDTLLGGAGDDRLFGGQDPDRLFGGTGEDQLFGGLGWDLLVGGAGHDVLSGGPGNDTVIGGANADTFVFQEHGGNDWIVDFDALNPHERLDLSQIAAITDFADFMASHAIQTFDDVLIRAVSQSDIIGFANIQIVLVGVDLADLDATDFIF